MDKGRKPEHKVKYQLPFTFSGGDSQLPAILRKVRALPELGNFLSTDRNDEDCSLCYN